MKSIENVIHINKKQLVISLACLVVVFFMAYGYLVNALIINIVQRESLEHEMGELIAQVGELEREYGALRSYITYQKAYILGFNEPRNQVFASQRQLVGNLGIE